MMCSKKLFAIILAGLVSLSQSVQAQDIVLGQSVPLSGNNADIGRDMRDGAMAVFSKLNASGGVQGRKIQLVTLDNANNRARALENTKELIDKHKALALFGYNSATNSLDALPLLTQNNMMLFAPFTGSPSARDHANVFTIRASYKDEAEKIVQQQKAIGATRAAIVHYDDEAGRANVQIVLSAFDAATKPRTLAVKRNVKLDAAAFEPVLADPPQYLLVTTQFTVIGDWLEVSKARGVNASLVALSFVNPDELADTYGHAARGTVVSQVVPAPSGNNLSANATVKECAQLLKTYNDTKLNFTNLEACIAAKAFVQVLQKAGAARVTRGSLLNSMEKVGRIGLPGFDLNFTGTHHGSKFVDLTILSRDKQFSK